MSVSLALRNCRIVFRRFVLPTFRSRSAIWTASVHSIRNGNGNFDCIHRIQASSFHVSASRCKKKPRKKKVVQEEAESEDEEESEEEEDDELASDYRLVDCPVASLRVDTLAKVGLGISRALVEQLIYEGKLRVDGQLCRKKAAGIDVGMTIDQILDASPDTTDFSNVRRLFVHKIHDRTDNQGRFIVTVKRWNSLTVDDYKLGAAKDEE